MSSNLKGDFIVGAFSQLRISGLTVDPSPEDAELALQRLEDMGSEIPFVSTGYYREDLPDPNTPHNVDRKFWNGFHTCLAIRLMPDFGKGFQPDPILMKQASAALSQMYCQTAQRPQMQYPSRMPRGSGTTRRWYRWTNFFIPESVAPISPDTIQMYIGDISDFTESFASYLLSGETIASVTITATDGLTVTTSSNTDSDVTYTIQAVGTTDSSGNPLLQLKMVVVTSSGRQVTRIINFDLTDSTIS